MSFSPLINDSSRVLILGSYPSIISLEAEFYYAHPRNAFWRIMEDISGKKLSSTSSKKDMLKAHRIALWDVIASCDRKGSLDSNIRDITYNNIKKLLASHPDISQVICNGTTAYKHAVKNGIKSVCLPSTSPANTMSFEEKLQIWSQYLRQNR